MEVAVRGPQKTARRRPGPGGGGGGRVERGGNGGGLAIRRQLRGLKQHLQLVSIHHRPRLHGGGGAEGRGADLHSPVPAQQ